MCQPLSLKSDQHIKSTRIYRILWILTLIVLLTISTSIYYFFYYIPFVPLSSKQETFVFELKPATGLKKMIKQLEIQGVFTSWQAKCFWLQIQLKRQAKILKAGEYAIACNTTPAALLKKLTQGEVIQHAFRIVEGMRVEQLLKNMHTHAAIKKTLLGKNEQEISTLLAISPALEGLFFPETYYFTKNTTDQALLLRAHRMMLKQLEILWKKRDPDLFLNTPYEALILASIIEKETALDDERFIISAVFQNRLAKKMRLQADPTVIYGTKSLKQITKNDLKSPSPYNTYLYLGLPPTPIAIPSRRSIEAALHPAKTPMLYFVAKGDKSHYFSLTLKEHNEAVKKSRQKT